MPKGTRKSKDVSKGSFGSYFGKDPMKGSISKEKARALVGDNGLKRLEKFPSAERIVNASGKDYITPKGKKMVAAKKKMESVAKKAVKSAAKKIKGKK